MAFSHTAVNTQTLFLQILQIFRKWEAYIATSHTSGKRRNQFFCTRYTLMLLKISSDNIQNTTTVKQTQCYMFKNNYYLEKKLNKTLQYQEPNLLDFHLSLRNYQ